MSRTRSVIMPGVAEAARLWAVPDDGLKGRKLRPRAKGLEGDALAGAVEAGS